MAADIAAHGTAHLMAGYDQSISDIYFMKLRQSIQLFGPKLQALLHNIAEERAAILLPDMEATAALMLDMADILASHAEAAAPATAVAAAAPVIETEEAPAALHEDGVKMLGSESGTDADN